jgi:hypothetical protein
MICLNCHGQAHPTAVQRPRVRATTPVCREDEIRLLRGGVVRDRGALTPTFILVPGPYPRALFTFIVQPLFAIVAIGHLLKVRADRRKRGR